jgi:16S rRNA (guanine527-N7)-methyltransferase
MFADRYNRDPGRQAGAPDHTRPGGADEIWRSVALTAGALEIMLPETFEPQARAYLGELRRWDRVARLTGYRNEAERVRHLVIDSLLLLAVLSPGASPLLDLGSGAGVPGLILKLARPGWAVTLVEANRRRANFLRQVVRELGLEGIEVAHMRAEALAAEPGRRGVFRTVTARAVGRPEAVLALARPFLAQGGSFVASLSPAASARIGVLRAVAVPPGAGLPATRRFLIMLA